MQGRHEVGEREGCVKGIAWCVEGRTRNPCDEPERDWWEGEIPKSERENHRGRNIALSSGTAPHTYSIFANIPTMRATLLNRVLAYLLMGLRQPRHVGLPTASTPWQALLTLRR